MNQPALHMHATRQYARARLILIALVLLGILVRLWLIGISPLDPRFSNADDGDYYRRALRFAVTGAYVDDAWLIRPPLHVFFYAACLKLALVLERPELGVLFIQVAQVAIAAVSILAGHAVALRLFASQRAGLIFAGFLAFWFPFVEQPSVLFSELLYMALFLVHVWLLLRFDQQERRRDLLLSGLALGAAALTRSPALYAVAFVALWMLLRPNRPRQWRTLVGQWLLVVVGCLLVVVPWTTRNYMVYQRLIPVDTLGQINLWLDLDRVADRNRNIETLRGLPQADRAGYALARARELLAENPLLPFDGIWPTFQHVWKAQYVEDYFLKQSFFTRPLRETAWLGLPGDLIWVILTLTGILALVGPLREGRHWRVFMLTWLAYSLVTVLVFHVEPRYLLPIWTLLGLYGAGWLARLGQKRSAPVAVRLLQGLVAAAFVVLLLSYRDYPSILTSGFARERGAIAGERAYLAGEYQAAEAGFRTALQAQPGFVDAQVGLALALGAQDRVAEAQAVLQRNASRRTELTYAALARSTGDLATAAALFPRYEAIAGEDVQRWALTWLRPPATSAVTLGNGLDLGYIHGFLEGEQSTQGSFRWMGGQAELVLPLPEPVRPGAILALRMSGGQAGSTPVILQIGNGPPQRLAVEGGNWRVYRLAIPQEAISTNIVRVQLTAPTFIPAMRNPASDDARVLSVMVAEVRVQ